MLYLFFVEGAVVYLADVSGDAVALEPHSCQHSLLSSSPVIQGVFM